MEYRSRWPNQARARGRSDPPLEDAVRAGRAVTLRPGQMVSGRKPAALGIRALLAQGRRADLEEFRVDRQDREPAQGRYRRCRALCRRYREETRRRFRVHHAGVRRSRPLVAEGSRPAVERRSFRLQIVRSGRAGTHGAGVRFRAQHATRICAADPALECGRRALEKRALETSARQPVPDAGRFADGLAAADLVAAVYSPRRLPLHCRAGSAGAARGTAGLRSKCLCSRRSTAGGPGTAAKIRRRPHRDVDRNPRRRALRLHAAGGKARGLPGVGYGG